MLKKMEIVSRSSAGVALAVASLEIFGGAQSSVVRMHQGKMNRPQCQKPLDRPAVTWTFDLPS